MRTLKTPDNAMLPTPLGSPGRELRRRQAKGRKTVAVAQSRDARQAKERTTPKKPKPEPKADEPKKPYLRTPAELETAHRVSDRQECRPPAPRIADRRNVAKLLLKKLNEDNCEQYGVSKIDIFRLRDVAYGALGKKTGGRKKGTPNKMTAALKDAILVAVEGAMPGGKVGYLKWLAKNNSSAFSSLLGKVLPTTLAGDPADPIHHDHKVDWSGYSDADLETMRRILSKGNDSEQPQRELFPRGGAIVIDGDESPL
jgi:hypothetical protein